MALDPLDQNRPRAHSDRAEERHRQAVPELLAQDKVELMFNEDALLAAADKALKQKTGARGYAPSLKRCCST